MIPSFQLTFLRSYARASLRLNFPKTQKQINLKKETIFPFGFLDSAGATSLLAILGSPSP